MLHSTGKFSNPKERVNFGDFSPISLPVLVYCDGVLRMNLNCIYSFENSILFKQH
jgi:hypothetical protein